MQPLDGVRVLDLTHVFAGPFAAYQLGVLGADVIKIEPPHAPDMMRVEGVEQELNALGLGLAFQTQGGGKRTLALDLKSVEGRAVFGRLVKTADVVIQNYSGGCAERLGLSYERLTSLKPDLIYCAISGFGQTGPKAAHPAYDNVIQAFAGVMASNGTETSGPVRIGPAVIDYGTGVQAALAIAAALYGRAVTGQGRSIDIAMADAALMLMASHTMNAITTGSGPRPHGNIDPDLAGYGCYETAEGWLMIGAYSNRQLAGLMQVLGNDAAAQAVLGTPRDQLPARHAKDMAFLKSALIEKTASEWEDLLNAHHVPAARVRTLEEALAEPQFDSRNVIQSVEAQTFPVAGFEYDCGTPKLKHAPHAHGEDSREILAEIGLGSAEIDRLEDQGIVFSVQTGATAAD